MNPQETFEENSFVLSIFFKYSYFIYSFLFKIKANFPIDEIQKAINLAEIVKKSWEGGELTSERLQEVFLKSLWKNLNNFLV